MSFTITDFHALTQLLYERPEWRAELRRLVLSDELLELPEVVRQIAQEQRALAEAQRALAEAQRRTEQRLEELAESQRALAEAQRRTEQRLEELAESQRALAEAQRRTGAALGQLQTVFGATVEDEAESMLQVILKDKGYRFLSEPFNLALDGEVDVVAPVETPDGHRAWVLVEAKARLSRREVRSWAQRTKSEGWRKRLAKREVPGPYLVYAYGIRIDRGAVEEAEQQGIGLLSGRGERVSPKGMIPAPSHNTASLR